MKLRHWFSFVIVMGILSGCASDDLSSEAPTSIQTTAETSTEAVEVSAEA